MGWSHYAESLLWDKLKKWAKEAGFTWYDSEEEMRASQARREKEEAPS